MVAKWRQAVFVDPIKSLCTLSLAHIRRKGEYKNNDKRTHNSSIEVDCIFSDQLLQNRDLQKILIELQYYINYILFNKSSIGQQVIYPGE
jgi:hypothetical protein